MPRRLRMYQEEGTYFVTARTVQGRFLIRPVASTNQVVGGVLARSARLSGVDVHAFVVTSNHLHAVVSARDGALSTFMQHFLGNVARKLGPLVSWRGPFWERRFAAEPILDAEAQERRLRYVLSHGAKEGLVRSPRHWPGLSCLRQLLNGAAERFPFFHWARRWRGGKLVTGGSKRLDPRWAEEETLTLSPLPAWRELPFEERRRRVETMIGDIEAESREKFRTVVGAEAIRRQHAHDGPATVKRSPEPLCHASSRDAVVEYKRAYQRFASWFREASERFLAGETSVEFPPRAFRPYSWVAAGP